jgi:tRNA dimethylallyltransferase
VQGGYFKGDGDLFLCEEEAQLEPTKLGDKDKVIVLAGPTGSGKTQLSIELGRAMGGEIISADSMQIYELMNIGTAKASIEQRIEVPHHLIDIRSVNDSFNVVDFFHEARQAIRNILQKGAIPIVVGGSGFYIRSLIYGPPKGPSSCPKLREKLEAQMQKIGPEALFEMLKVRDSAYAETITVHDKQKIIRGLEIIELTGKRVSDIEWKQSDDKLDFNFKCWFIYRPREVLYKIIEDRCDKMIEEGFLEEIEKLQEKGIEGNASASHSIGYKHGLQYLSSQRTPEDFAYFLRMFKQSSRRYAKRQFTWFRNESLFRWLNIELHDPETVLDIILRDYSTD